MQAIEEFPEAIAIFDQDKDGDLDCVYSKRVNYDETTHEAAYTWFLQGDNDKGTEYAATVHYSDYKDCLIIELPFHTTLECVLWISVEVKDNIPQTCIDMYEDNCDNTPPIYSQNTCDEEEDFLKSLRVPGL
ncbi:uncharacterized protein LOC144159841 [Haemaphysalis longicornis]